MQVDEVNLQHTDAALLRLTAAAKAAEYSFTTPTPCTHERVNSREGNLWATDLRGALGWNRPFTPEILPPTFFELMQQADLLQNQAIGWRSRLRLSSLDGQLYWHSGFPTHDPNAVFFGPDTYRFVRAIRQHLDASSCLVRRALDIGCGAGPGAINIALARPDAQVWASDINTAALRLTALNARSAGARNVRTQYSNLLDGVQGAFDLIVANPPYLNDPLERIYRHGGGSHGQGLATKMITAALPRLSPKGCLLLYTGATIVDGQDTFLDEARQILQRHPDHSWTYEEIDPDVFGEELEQPAYQDADRIAAVLLKVRARDGA